MSQKYSYFLRFFLRLTSFWGVGFCQAHRMILVDQSFSNQFGNSLITVHVAHQMPKPFRKKRCESIQQ